MAESSLAPAKTSIQIGDKTYDITLSQIPYLSSFVSFQNKAQPHAPSLIHGPIPLFETALQGIESGFRQCFRTLDPDLPDQYHILCTTYQFLCVNILSDQSLEDIIADLKAGKNDYEVEYKSFREVRGDKSKARDAAFKLVHLILLGEFVDEIKDSAKVFNAVLYIVSHSATFKWKTRNAVRAAFEERFVCSAKQMANLERWEKARERVTVEEDSDVTTEEEVKTYDYDSDSDFD